MKKFFCDSACFFLALALLMVVSAAIEGTLTLLPALGIALVLGIGMPVLYRIGWGDPVFRHHRRAAVRRVPKPQTIRVAHSASHTLGAA